MAHVDANVETNGRQPWRWTFMFFAGPIMWALQLFIGYGLASYACSASKIPVYVLGVIMALIVLAAGVLAYQSWQRLTPEERPSLQAVDEPHEWPTFIAVGGFLVSLLFLGLIVITAVVALFLSPCPPITMPFP